MKLDLLYKMLETPSVSGNEVPFQKMLINEMKDIDDAVYTHHTGNVIHALNTESKVKIMLLAHIDEIGLIIKDVESNGILKLTSIGGIRPYMYLGQHVNVIHYNDNCEVTYIPGVIGSTPNMNSANLKVDDLNLDLGFKDKEEALKKIKIGDVVIHRNYTTRLENDLLASKALDDKIGAFICTEVLREVKNKTKNGVYFAATVGEETTGRGAKVAVAEVNPSIAIALDVGSSGDVHYRDGLNHNISLGSGPILTIANHANQRVTKILKEEAEKLSINLQTSIEIEKTYTDMDSVYDKNGGIPSQLISIPLRYMHSSVEVCSLKDVENIINLLVAFIMAVTEKTSFNPFEQ